MRKFAAFLILILCFGAVAVAQIEPVQLEQKEFTLPKNEIFGGYSYNRQSGIGMNGFDLSFSHYFGGPLRGKAGITLEVTRLSNSMFDITGDGFVHTSYLAGPTVRLHRYGFFSPSVHVLGGIDRATLSMPGPGGVTVSFEDTDYAISGGGTLDGNLSRHVAVRMAQVDYLYVHHATGHSSFRYSGGLVIRF